MNKLLILALIIALAHSAAIGTACTGNAAGQGDCDAGLKCKTDADTVAADTVAGTCYYDTGATGCTFEAKDFCSGTEICITSTTGVVVVSGGTGDCTARIAANASCTEADFGACADGTICAEPAGTIITASSTTSTAKCYTKLAADADCTYENKGLCTDNTKCFKTSATVEVAAASEAGKCLTILAADATCTATNFYTCGTDL